MASELNACVQSSVQFKVCRFCMENTLSGSKLTSN